MKSIVSFCINIVLLLVVLAFNFVPALIPNITVQAILLIIAGILISQLLESTTMFNKIDTHLQKLIEQKNFTANDLSESLTIGFEKCRHRVSVFRVFAISTTKILSAIELKDDIHIVTCKIMVRSFSDFENDGDRRFNYEIENNIQRWKKLQQKGIIENLTVVRYDDLPHDFTCIFEDKFLTLGLYASDEADISRVAVEGTFSITDKTESGKLMIEKYSNRFDTYLENGIKNNKEVK